MVQSAIGLLLGILLFQQLPALPPLWIAPVLPVLGATGLPRRAWLAAAALGFGWAWYHAAATLETRLPPGLAGRTVIISGSVKELPERHGGGQRFRIAVEELVAGTEEPQWTGEVRLTWRAPPAPVRAGQRCRLKTRLFAPSGFRNPGGFDYEQWLYVHGLAATGYVLSDRANACRPHERLDSLHNRAREAIRDRVELAGGSVTATALFSALMIGDRGGFAGFHWEVFRATGTSHLVAISGLHLGLISGLVFWLTSRLWRRSAWLCLQVPAGYAGALFALVAAGGYALLAGFALPTQRALVMIAAGLGALSLRRVVTPPGGLAVALIAVLIFDPNAVLGGGFWLSFAAVSAIFLVTSGQRIAGKLASWWRVQWSVTFGLMPVLAAWTLPLAGISPLVNLLAVPWFTLVVVPLSFLSLLLGFLIPSWGARLLELDLRLLDWTFAALQFLAESSGWQWTASRPSVPVVLLAGVGVVVFLVPLPLRHRALGLAMLLPLAFRPGAEVPAGGVRVAMLDVGQGLSVVVRTENHTLVYDLGPRFSDSFNAAEAVVVPFLDSEAVRRVDRLVLSHDDADHAGAWPEFLDRVAVDALLAGQPEKLTAGALPCRQGDTWTWDGVGFEVLHPADEGAGGHDNDASCVLRIVHPRARFLLTGDITRSVEQRLAGKGVAADFVLVPHHGSGSSSSSAFVSATGAQFALVSAGYRNRYGFPDPAVAGRWRDAGARILNTAEAGAVIIEAGAGGELLITRYRDAARRYWHR